jgi:hypothetical protein
MTICNKNEIAGKCERKKTLADTKACNGETY